MASRRRQERQANLHAVDPDLQLSWLRESNENGNDEPPEATADAPPAAAGDRQVSLAGELAKRLQQVVRAVVAGHPATHSDVQTLKEAADFLDQLAGPSAEEKAEAATTESLEWLRRDGTDPMPRQLKRSTRKASGRALTESANRVPASADDQLKWLRGAD